MGRLSINAYLQGLSAATIAAINGAHIIRTHDVQGDKRSFGSCGQALISIRRK
jgi:dihydropteroate synthase